MSRWAPPVLMVALASACGNVAVRIESRSLADEVSQSPERFIILAADIDPGAFSTHAGNAPRGHLTSTPYEATTRARQVMRSLESEYRLREVGAWPIEPLHMHCVVLEIPADADRVSLLTKLSRDPRISLAQPLQTFATRTEDSTISRGDAIKITK
jgi:hypothetical protein